MTTAIANPPTGSNHPNDSENPAVDNDNKSKETIMKYLSECGLDTSSVPFSFDDIDESSVALLVQLSQQESDADPEENENHDDSCVVKNKNDTPAEKKVGMQRQEKQMKSLQKEDLKTKSESIQAAAVKKKDCSVSAPSHLQAEDSTTKIEERCEEILNSNNTSLNDSLVFQMANEMRTKSMENRHFEEVLAKYSLDSKSFAQSSFTAPDCSAGSESLPALNKNNEWQKILFDKLDQQHQHISKCQEQIQALAMLIAQDMVERRQILDTLRKQGNANATNNNTVSLSSPFLSIPSPTSKDFSMFVQAPMGEPSPMTMGTRNNTPSQQPQQNQQAAPAVVPELQPGQSLLFTLLGGFFDKLLFFPRHFITFMNTTKLVRLVNAIKVEAEKFRQRGELRNGRFIEWPLIMKLCVFCFFLFIRFDNYDERIKRDLSSASAKKARRGLAELTLWQNRRTFGIVCIFAIAYIFKTGLWKFFHHILVKDNVLLRVWRNEDLNDDGNGNTNDNGEGNVATSPRRGRRDRDANNENNHNNAHGPLDGQGGQIMQTQQEQGRLRNIVNYVQQQTFLGGQIDHPINRVNNSNNNQRPVSREQILLDRVIDSVKDVVYFFGSFLLSLLPMWHPIPREMPREMPEVNDTDAYVGDEVGNDENNENNNGEEGGRDEHVAENDDN